MIASVASPTAYRRMVESVRLSSQNADQAAALQKLGWTFSEISVSIDANVEAVKRSLYWDLRP